MRFVTEMLSRDVRAIEHGERSAAGSGGDCVHLPSGEKQSGYGTMSYSVARQVGEIGIRMDLGAQRGVVVWTVLRRVLLLAAVGLAISVPAA